MTTKNTITLQKLKIDTIRKDIKNIHLGVYPPKGEIRVSVPLDTNDETLRLFLISKTSWIKKQQRKFSQQKRQTSRKYTAGESHYLFGKEYRLKIISTKESSKIIIKKTSMDLYLKSNYTVLEKEKIFEKFYRQELEKVIPKLLKKWESKVDVKSKQIKTRKMKTKWGSCDTKKKQILLNLELAKKPFHCIDYVLVHELVHLKERKHNDRFIELLESAYPKWQEHKEELNQGILSHFEWGCKSNPKLKDVIEN